MVSTVTGDLGTYGVKSPFANDGVAIALSAEYRKNGFAPSADAIYREQNGGTDFTLLQDVREGIEVQPAPVQERRFAHMLQANGGHHVSRYGGNPSVLGTWTLEGICVPSGPPSASDSYPPTKGSPRGEPFFLAGVASVVAGRGGMG